LASQLRYGRPVQTVTSMRENQCSLEEAGGSVTLVDVPGHPRLRENIREKYAARAKSVVFVIDAKEFKDRSREQAECVPALPCPPHRIDRLRRTAAALPRPRPDPAARVALVSLLLNILDDSDFRSRSLLVACNKVRASLPAGIQTRWRVLDAQLIAAMGVPASRTMT